MALDPKRYPYARLVDPSHKMPFRGRWFGVNEEHPGYERLDIHDPFSHYLINSGSVELVDPETAIGSRQSAVDRKPADPS